MTIKDGYYIWTKNQKQPINSYFNTKEFTCQCNYSDCIEQKISVDLVERLTKLREAINSPLIITSGFRCSKHQKDLIKAGVNTVVATKSQHELGNAVDCYPLKKQIDMNTFLEKAKELFYSIGIANNFLHLDIRPKKQNGEYRLWKY